MRRWITENLEKGLVAKKKKWSNGNLFWPHVLSILYRSSCRRDNSPFTHCIPQPSGRDIASSIWCHSPVRLAMQNNNNNIIINCLHLLSLYTFSVAFLYCFSAGAINNVLLFLLVLFSFQIVYLTNHLCITSSIKQLLSEFWSRVAVAFQNCELISFLCVVLNSNLTDWMMC